MNRALWPIAALAVTLLAPRIAQAGTPSNLIANPSVESIVARTGLPTGWSQDRWGTNTTQFSVSKDAEDGTKSLMVKITKYSSGDAKWYFTPVNVSGGTRYTFGDYYKATVSSTIVVRFASTTGNLSYLLLGAKPAAGKWTACSYTFMAPVGAAKATVFHLIGAAGTLQTDNFSLVQTTTAPPGDTTKPAVAFTSPSSGATLAGTVIVRVSASDNVAVAQVALAIDGIPLSTLTTAPYTWSLDTASLTNGVHSLTATATDASNNSASTSVTVNVANAPSPPLPPPPVVNLVPNNSVEQAGSSGSPVSWYTDRWGTNTTAFGYLPTGYTGTRGLQVQITQYTSGDAKWYFAPQAVTPGAYYRYSDHYISNVITHVVVALRSSTGTITYAPLQDAPASSSWTTYTDALTIPPGIATATVYHVLSAVGTLTTDEFSFVQTAAPTPFARAIVTLNFDDGNATDYDTVLPILQKYGVHATHYIISGEIGDTANGYMSADQITALAAYGDEIGSHTVTHPYLTQLTPSEVTSELADSQRALQSLLGQPVTDFALPYGDYDAQVIDQIKTYYRSARTTITGYNTPNNFNPYRIVVQPLDCSTSPATVASWVDTASANHYWLVLMYHKVDDSGGSSVPAKNLDAALAYIKGAGVQVETVSQALDELTPQAAR
jgi:peptidoglycan/xylan/chitin deacetylase (PgdA/CDA1 family)